MRVDQRQTRDRGERVRERIVRCGPETRTVVSLRSAEMANLARVSLHPQTSNA